MVNSWRLLVVAVVVSLTVGVAGAAAQTVIVRNIPAGEAVEVVLNATKVASGVAGEDGSASVPVSIQTTLNKSEIDANIAIDTCDKLRRVFIVESGRQMPAEEDGCRRRSDIDLFLVRTISSVVLDMATPNLHVILVQGRYVPLAGPNESTAPRGLLLSAGGGLMQYTRHRNVACGDTVLCEGRNATFAGNAAATYWVTKNIGVDMSYWRPRAVAASGSGDTYGFRTTLATELLMIAAKYGFPKGIARVYGQAGVTYARTTRETNQTLGTDEQTLVLKTQGRSWFYGGGVEVWLKPKFAIYIDGGMAGVKGKDIGDGEGVLDDRVSFVAIGGRYHLGF